MTSCPGRTPPRRDPVQRAVLAEGGQIRLSVRHPLPLHPEHVDDVGARDRADVGGRLASERLDPARDERRRPDERRPGADELERLDERARDPRVEHVADDRDVHALEPPERVLDRVQVEERLRRMLVSSVAGVHDVRIHVRRRRTARRRSRMPDHEHVRVVGRERERGVAERLALVDRGAGGAERHRVGRQALRRELEARERPRRGLVEEVDDRPTAERRKLLHVALD